jgi:capsular polysaccharide biosynthesis protein
VTVGDVYRALWRHKLFIVVLTVAVVAAAWVAVSRQQRTYTASSLIRIQQNVQNPNDLYGALETGGRLAQTYQQIVSTTTIARRIAALLRGRVPYDGIVGNVSASQVEQLDLLTINARSPDPTAAAEIANAAPQALRDFIRQTATLGDQIITIQPATVPSTPSSPRPKVKLAIALLLGLIVNSVLALLIEIVGDRVYELEEFEQLARAPVLGFVPNLELTAPPADPRPVGISPKLEPVELGEASSRG